MEKIVWNDELFSVGYPILDEQHKTVIGMINELIDLSSTDYSRADLLRILIRMASYSSYHFGVEEALLKNIGSQHLDEQIQAHAEYAHKVSDLIVNCTGEDLNKVLMFLVKWWVDHILIEDMKFK